MLFAVAAFAFAANAVAQTKITMWSHWAAEKIKRAYVEDAIKRFEAANPGVKIKITWYEKSALYASLKTALRAGQAPDVFYAEPDQTDYIENDLLPTSRRINWNNVEPWAKQAWTFGKGTYGLPLEASTVEVYYNTKLMATSASTVPASGQFDPAAFLDLVKKARRRASRRWRRASATGRIPAHTHARGAAEEARAQGLRRAAEGQAVVERPARRRDAAPGEAAGRRGGCSDELHQPEARRVAHLLPHQPRRADVPGGSWYTVARLQPARQGRAAGRTSRSASCSRRR